MANTKVSTMLATTAVLALAACGGGSSSVSNNPTLPSTTSPKPVDERSVNVRNHTSGVQVYIGDEIDENQLRRFAAAVTDQATLEFVYTGDITQAVNLIRTSYWDQNQYGEFTKVDFSIAGTNYSTTIFVDEQTSEAVSVSGTFIAGVPNVVAEGAQLTSIPNGVFTYRGGLIQSTQVNSFSSGSFTMVADFNNSNADFTANTSTDNIFATNIPIKVNTGTFSSNNLTIASPFSIFNPTYTAQLDGSFTGVNASGVVGVYSTTGGEKVGGFAGVR
jgi:hypothetical protein